MNKIQELAFLAPSSNEDQNAFWRAISGLI